MLFRIVPAALAAVLLLSSAGLGGKEIAFRRFGGGQPAEPVKVLTDAEALVAAKLKPDDAAGLLSYFRQRTVSNADLAKIQSSIKQLGADEFDDRLKAADAVEKFGPAAIGPLRAAFKTDADPEISYRSLECLGRLEKVPHSFVAAAAARALAKSKPDGTAEVLLGFLPFADDQSVTDEIGRTLAAVALKGGKADPVLVAALADPVTLRRGAAVMALVEGSPAGGIPADILPKIRKAAEAEADAEIKFRIVFALCTTTRDKEAVDWLVGMLADLPRGRLWQAEDFLLQLAGKDAPGVQFKKTPESVTKARDAWKKWWDAARDKSDLAKFKYAERITGKTVLVMWDQQQGNNGYVAELGPDMKERWKVNGLSGPSDVAFLPDGNMAIPEMHANRVTIRDRSGRVIANINMFGNGWKVQGGQPVSIQALDNGNLFLACRNGVHELKKTDGNYAPVASFVRQQHDIMAAHRLPDGQTIVLANQNGQIQPNGQNQNFAIFLNDKLAEVPNKKLTTPMPYWMAAVSPSGPDRVLVADQQQVSEYDLKENKVVWKKACNQPRSPQRLPNGNTLYVDPQNRLIEVTTDGEEVWSYQAPQGMLLYKAIRR